MSEYQNYTLTQLAELILRFDHQEGLSPASLENLKEFAKSALENASQQTLASDVLPCGHDKSFLLYRTNSCSRCGTPATRG